MARAITKPAATNTANSLAAWPAALPPWAPAALLVVATCWAYLPALSGGFILDDDWLITDNRLVRASDGLARIWFSTEPFDYWPVTNTLFWIEWRLFGLHPLGYHLVSLALHVATAVLLWLVLKRLKIPGALLAALLWAVHPVNVEATAWITQQKTILALLFGLLSVLYFSKTGPQLNFTRDYWLSLLFFVLGILSKGSIAVLPPVLLLILWWANGRVTWDDLRRIAPFVAVAVPLIGVNIWFQGHLASEGIRTATIAQRLAGAGAVVWFYLYTALWPFDLIFIYPDWKIHTDELRWWLPLVATLAVTAALFWQRKTPVGRALLVAWGVFLLAVAPVMGLTDVGFMKYALVADHYEYIPLVAVTAIVAAGWSIWRDRASELGQGILATAAGLLVAALMWLTWQQCTTFRDPMTLYETTLARNPECWLAHDNIGALLVKQDQSPEALPHFQKALELNPKDALAHYNLGFVALKAGDAETALRHLEVALKLRPYDADVRNNLSGALFRLGRIDEAIAESREVLRRQPEFTKARFNLGNWLLSTGYAQEAIPELERTTKELPDFADAHARLGRAYLDTGKPQQAFDQFIEALRLEPQMLHVEHDLSIALLQLGRLEEAIVHLREAIRQAPDDVIAWHNLGAALLNTNHPREAVDALEKAARLQPEDPDTQSNLARALIQSGRAQDAIAHIELVIRKRPDDPVPQVDMSDALAQVDRWDESIAAAERALAMARTRGPADLAEQIEARLATLHAARSSANPQLPGQPAPSPVLPPSP